MPSQIPLTPALEAGRRACAMVKTASLFSQLLKHFPRARFATLVKKHRAERHAKGFTCWNQFVSMLFCQLAGADSLREICNGLSCCLGKLKHIGIDKAPKKSTLCYANEHRPAELYEDVFYETYDHFANQSGFGHRKHKFRFKNKLLSLDSSTISLCLALFPWAKFRRAKGGVKVHVLLDHDVYMPAFVRITEAKQHDIKAARLLRLNPGSIVAMDRAYNDFELFGRWCQQEVFFVTRMKENTQYDVVETRAVPPNSPIICDEIVYLVGVAAERKCPYPLRRIVVWDADNKRQIVLLTNHLKLSAATIGAIYKERWQIELFFKALKQNLKVKTFVGTSENALRIQIWTALIAILLLKWMHYLSKAQWSLSNLASMLRLNLFTYRDLMQWLHNPFETEPIVPEPQQLELRI
jgi:hypothetical protein